jgi:hypothetical protein
MTSYNENAMASLILSMTEDEVDPFVQDSDDWDNLIIPALLNWAVLLDIGNIDLATGLTFLKGMAGIIYVMGYNRRKSEEQEPKITKG